MNKSYRIRQKDLLSLLHHHSPCRRIKGSKKLILFQNTRTGKMVQQCGFPCVGISYDGNGGKHILLSGLTGNLPRLLHIPDLGTKSGHPAADGSTVCLQFRLSGTSCSDSSSQP